MDDNSIEAIDIDDVDNLDLDDILDDEEINQLLEQAPEIEQLDPDGLKKLVKVFEETYTENTKQRIKFADDPTKYDIIISSHF